MAYSDNTVTATIKLRTSLPNNDRTYKLQEGEVYIDASVQNKISIYIGSKDGDKLVPVSNLTPLVLRVNGNSLEPETIGGFTNSVINDETILTGTSEEGGTVDNVNITSLKKLILNRDIYGNLPESGTEGQVFFVIGG